MIIQFQPNYAATFDLVTAANDTGYTPLAPIDWGNAVWERASSGPRGTQGAKVASAVPKNRPLVIPLRIRGSSKTDAATKASALVEAVRNLNAYGGRIKVKSNNLTYATYYEVFSGQLEEKDWGNRAEVVAIVDYLLSFDCAPYLLGDAMSIDDTFATDTEADYTFDTGSASDVAITGGQLKASANLTTEKRLCHTALGYTYGDHQATIKTAPHTTITNYKAGVWIKRTSDDDGIAVYVDDDGASSRLRIDVVNAGTPTNRASTNLGARVSSATAFWVRGRIEGNVVIAEYFTSEPTPMSTPTTTNTYTLAGAEITNFGSAVEGRSSITWIPQHASAYIEEFRVWPLVYRNQTLPQKITLYGSLPGDAPALVDIDVTTSGGSAAPIWALLAHAKRTTPSVGLNPFGILSAESATIAGGWSASSAASGRDDDADAGNTSVRDTGATSAETYTLVWSLDPSAIFDDPGSPGEMRIELWARMELSSTLVTPRLIASIEPATASIGAKVYTAEHGSTGKILTVPSSGTVYRLVRVGTITVPRTIANASGTYPALKLQLEGVLGTGTSGTFGCDNVIAVPIRRRACLESGVPNDSTFGKFARVTTEVTKTIRSDLVGLVAAPPAGANFDNGLGGELLEFYPGDNDLLVKLSSLVPDDPTSDTTTEQLAHSATVRAKVTPRWELRRDV